MKYILTLCAGILLGAGATYFHISTHQQPYISHAICTIHPTLNSTTSGTITFHEKTDGTHINATLSGLNPGKHGFHVHEFGDCSCADGTCTKGHFNPTNKPHGGPNDTQRHVGDMGNITADENGNAVLNLIDTHIKLNGPYSIIGRSIIVHADKDDLSSQPTGNAGARIGCGVIGIAENNN